MPSLLVVSPSLNQGQFIEQMIRSVLSELGPEDRFVIVDAGSTDATPEVLKRYEDRFTHVEVAPLSQAAAIRWGFDNFTSDLCCYLNTDDVLLPGAVASAKARFAEAHDVGALYSHRLFIDENAAVRRIWRLPRHSNTLMRRWDYIPQETCFWRREAMDRVGGIDAGFDFAMDYDFFCRLMNEVRFERMSGFLAAFREHQTSKTQTLNESVGADEVATVRRAHGVQNTTTHWGWRAVGRALRHYVEWGSALALSERATAQLQAQVDQATRAAQGTIRP